MTRAITDFAAPRRQCPRKKRPNGADYAGRLCGIALPPGIDERLFARCRQLAEAVDAGGTWVELKGSGCARRPAEELAAQGPRWFAVDAYGVTLTDEGRLCLLGGPRGCGA